MTKRTRTLVLIAVLVPVALLLGGAIALKLFFTGDRLKAMVIPRMEEATGRAVAIGEIGLSVFPSIAVEIDSLRIANSTGPGFSPDPMLSLERLRLSVSLMALLGGNVEVTSLLLERPRLLLEVNAENHSNYADLGGEAGTGAAEPSAAALSLFVSSLRVEDGSLAYLNHKTDAATVLRSVSIDAALETAGADYIVDGRATADSLSYGSVGEPMIDGLTAALDFRLDYDVQEDLLTFRRGTLMVQQIPLELSGTLAQLRGATVVNLLIGSESVSIPALFALLPRASTDRGAEVTGTGNASVAIDITGVLTDSTEVETRGRIVARDATVQYGGLDRPITDITMLAEFTRTSATQEIRVDTLSARFGDWPVTLALRVVDFDDPRLTLSARAAMDLAQLGDFYPLEEGTQLAGTLQSTLRASGAMRDPRQMRVAGTLDVRGVSIETADMASPLRNLTGSVTFTNQVMEARRLSFVLGKSDLAVGVRMTNYLSLLLKEEGAPRPSATLTLQSTTLRSDDFMRPERPGTGRDGRDSRAQPSGLPLPDLPMDLTVTIGTLQADKFSFRNVRGSVGIAEGVVNLRALTLNTFGGGVTASGRLNLRDRARPAFDLTLDMRKLQATELLTPFTSFGERLGGTLSMETKLAGMLNDTLGLVPSSLNGQGTVSIADGSLKGFRVNEVVASTFNLPDLETVNFRDWRNSFLVRDGRLQLNNLVVKALNAEYVVNGSHGLDGTIDYRMELYLPPETAAKVQIPGFAGEAVNLFKDSSGRLRFDFNVGGTTTAPTLRLDTESARAKAEQMANDKLKEEMQRLENTVKDKAKDILNNLLKPPQD